MSNHEIVQEFPKTSINRKAGDVWAAAARGPVSLSDHGTSRFVVMARDIFDELVENTDARVVRKTSEIPEDEVIALGKVLQGILDEDE